MPFNWFGDEVSKKTKKAANKAMYQTAENLLTEANKKVPHDEGTLEKSGTVRQKKLPDYNPVYSKAKKSKERKYYKVDWYSEPLFYVAYNTPYAVRLHEAAPGEYNFRGGRESKWLENTSKKLSGRMEQWAAKEFRKWMK